MGENSVPAWALAVIAVLLISFVLVAGLYFIRKRARRSGVVDIAEKTDKRTSLATLRTLVASKHADYAKESTVVASNSISILPTASVHSMHSKESKKYPMPDTDDRHPYDITNEDIPEPVRPAPMKISLPLPPPSTSLFSDKMELNSDEAKELFEMYMKASQTAQDKNKDGHVVVDMDGKQPFYSAMQSKAATIKSTLRQSIRRKSLKPPSTVPVMQMFASPSASALSTNDRRRSMSRQSSSESHPQKSSTSSRVVASSSSSANMSIAHLPSADTGTNKTMMDDSIKDYATARETNVPLSVETESLSVEKDLCLASPVRAKDSCPMTSEDRPLGNDDHTMDAARRVIRSASRKAKTRSAANPGDSPKPHSPHPESIPAIPSPTHHSAKVTESSTSYFSSVRSRNPHVFNTLTSRTPDDTDYPLPKTDISSTKPSAKDISDWWSPDNSSHRATEKVDVVDSQKSKSGQRALVPSTSPSGLATISGKTAVGLLDAQNQESPLHMESKKASTIGRGAAKLSTMQSSVRGAHSLRNMFDPRGPSGSRVPARSAGEPKTARKAPDALDRPSVESVSEDLKQTAAEIPSSPHKEQPAASSTTPASKKQCGNNVDTIRRMLQATWNANNLKESGSMSSLGSSEASGSFRLAVSPPGSINPRQLNHHLVSLSLKAQQQSHRRPAMPAGFMGGDDFIIQAPAPTASFSSSTVRTMIPAEEQVSGTEALSSGPDDKNPAVPSNKHDHSNSSERFGTLRSERLRSQNQRAGMPWSDNVGKDNKTPAQRERDQYMRAMDTQRRKWT
ncbi:uncharacterized protein BYT42DRAFT_644356 [Radiomyces spectabilis]|uniref:uncharacterized protein n=1 Tax=Radiomyces spectabilis TaxID=64574 RepID=UPI00221FE691|nr:uncharacterized protein BYT42DRAFT_644356 [Radiomyces spectabilis]KAI8381578.1 hypothetical protein BYT42DRAFT_644356 [Radiomyces spectabilis]